MWYNNELKHYGVLGMRWGVRKEYEPKGRLTRPSRKEYNKDKPTRKLVSQKNSKRDTVEKDKQQRKGLTDKQKKYIKIGAIVVGTALVAYGGYQLYKSGKLDGLINKGKESFGESIDTKTGFKLKSPDKLSIVESRVNDLKNTNRGWPLIPGTTKNCTHCVTSNELRIRGLDVEATKNFNPRKFSDFGRYFEMFIPMHNATSRLPNENDSEFRKRATKALCNELIKEGAGARGVIGAYHLKGDHVFSWEVIGDKVVFTDAQTGTFDVMHYLTDRYDGGRYEWARLDDLPIKSEFLQEVAKNKN